MGNAQSNNDGYINDYVRQQCEEQRKRIRQRRPLPQRPPQQQQPQYHSGQHDYQNHQQQYSTGQHQYIQQDYNYPQHQQQYPSGQQQYPSGQQQQLARNTRVNETLGMSFEYPNQTINAGNVNGAMDRLNRIEEDERNRFEQEEERRKRAFESEQNRRRDYFANEIKKFEESYDPYSILGLEEGCDKNELKKQYKKMAMKYHPDRNNGKTDNEFKLITQSYLYILKKIEEKTKYQRKINRDVEYTQYDTSDVNEQRENIYLDKDNFNVDNFNKIFEQYRIPTAYDDGYKGIMSGESGEREDAHKLIEGNTNNIFSSDFNIDIFNKTFNNTKTRSETKIIKYEEPQAINSGSVGYSELGISKVDNYGVKNDGLGYTDYKIAHQEENTLIDVDSVEVKSFKTINELKAHRSKITHTMTPQERQMYEARNREAEQREQQRLATMEDQDRYLQEHYNKINRLMIRT